MIGRRYQLEEVLGAGGMGTVYSAYDRLTRQQVALKQVHTEDAEGTSTVNSTSDLRLSLAQEFRLLSSLHHPNVINVLDYGFRQRQPFFSMELLRDATTILQAGQNQPLQAQCRLVMQVLQALDYLHRRQVTHCDLKPNNILVAQDRVKVLDFGLSMRGGQRSDGTHTTAGTLGYMAPEVLAGSAPTSAADLYAVGVIAYELFLNKPPFSRDNLNQMIRQVMYAQPDLLEVDNAALSLFLERLLAKTPAERYPTAQAALRALADAVHIPLPPETLEIRDSFLQTAPLIGRETELQTLTTAFENAVKGNGGGWLIIGESGIGKSRLIEEIRIKALVEGATVLRGRTAERSGGLYALWQPIFRWLVMLNDISPEEAAVLLPIAPDIRDLIDERVIADSTASVSPKQVWRVVSDLFSRIEGTVVVILEDLQWIDEDSLYLLTRLSQLAETLPLLVLCSLRDDEAPQLISRLPAMQVLSLSRLETSDIEQLSEAILGASGRRPEVVALLQRETEGNIFFIIEVVRALAAEFGELTRIGTATLPAQVYAGGIAQVVQRRLTRLPDYAREPLKTASLMGRQLDLIILARLFPSLSIEQWLTDCASAAILEYQDTGWRFTHDRLRDALLDEFEPETRRTAHLAIAQALESEYGASALFVGALAFHYGAAGVDEKECLYSAQAADLALRGGVYSEAISRYSRALDLLPTLPSTPTLDESALSLQLAEAYLGVGRYLDAQQRYRAALERAAAQDDQPRHAYLLQRLGDIEYALANFETAEAYYRESLAHYRALQDSMGIATTLNSLGNVAYELGNDDEATRFYQESLALKRATGGAWGMAGAMANSDE